MPLFQFRCPTCSTQEDRLCTNDEKRWQTCYRCHSFLVYEFVPTRSRPIVYANDSIHPKVFTGPRQRERYLADRGFFEIGSESIDTVHKEGARMAAEVEERREQEINCAVDEMLTALGDELYTSEPEAPHEPLPAPEGIGE